MARLKKNHFLLNRISFFSFYFLFFLVIFFGLNIFFALSALKRRESIEKIFVCENGKNNFSAAGKIIENKKLFGLHCQGNRIINLKNY